MTQKNVKQSGHNSSMRNPGTASRSSSQACSYGPPTDGRPAYNRVMKTQLDQQCRTSPLVSILQYTLQIVLYNYRPIQAAVLQSIEESTGRICQDIWIDRLYSNAVCGYQRKKRPCFCLCVVIVLSKRIYVHIYITALEILIKFMVLKLQYSMYSK